MASRGRRESIARSRRRLALGLTLATGCAASEPPAAPPRLDGGHAAIALAERLREIETDPRSGALVVRLAFEAGADLDLYVTDPLTESVYFANTPVRSGGALDADATCDDAAPRIETIAFEAPLAGRYRIGVDHIRSCAEPKPAPFAVRVEHGAARWEATGALPRGRFDPIVLELDLD